MTGDASMIRVWTDGACRGNPGPGGWAARIDAGGTIQEIAGAEPHTTNNRMEMLAAIHALEALPEGAAAHVTTDSQYVLKGITEWIAGWRRRGWKTAANKPVLNVDLWQRLDRAVQCRSVAWEWVRGHSGHVENERVDALANAAIDAMHRERRDGGGGHR